MPQRIEGIASTLVAMVSNLQAMASNLLAMACTLVAMGFNLEGFLLKLGNAVHEPECVPVSMW